ncbi:patatin-like phospholipase family protein [Sphingomonas sp.]|uniref:patatin-like phospholipase family protein n=1 Tax=Sphingomonas sp. TaxID=28214 RepID=UPI001D8104A8|nr:patatin-like phospholipase family protein [Sphingomonas sp.]MBX9795944.1 patatin-like phospholipase family protein [Sphingomonas sp.]
MADQDSLPRRRRAKAMPLPEQVALVLQGGGALGSYQAGVIEGLAEAGIDVDWVAGISIGAINAAIVAGNPPERRVERLHQFWDKVTSALPAYLMFPDEQLRALAHQWSAGYVLMAGVPGFFEPRGWPPQFAPPGSEAALSYYDTRPLRETLDALIDWDRVNDGPVRLSVGAVNLESGNFRYFDTTTDRIDARHIMASGALPPGLPPVDIDGCLWWDGGLVSNTPLSHVLENQTHAMLAFQVDLFPAAAKRPRTMADVEARVKEIRFSSRTRLVSDQAIHARQEHEAVRKLLAKLPPELRHHAYVDRLAEMVEDKPLNIVQLIHRAKSWESDARDYEFSAMTMREHWAAGYQAIEAAMANAEVLAQNILTGASAAFDICSHNPDHPGCKE